MMLQKYHQDFKTMIKGDKYFLHRENKFVLQHAYDIKVSPVYWYLEVTSTLDSIC